jgi:hypothetical protein
MRRVLLSLLLTSAAAAQVAPIPMSDEIGGQPYAIRNKWVIGGNGNWDYLTVDPAAHELFIAHQTEVQVVDLAGGQVSGRVTGFSEARAIVLDPDGQYGYVSDSGAQAIVIFDRRRLEAVASIYLPCAPRSIALAAQHQLLFAFCGAAAAPRPRLSHLRRVRSAGSAADSSPDGHLRASEPSIGKSHILIIDLPSRSILVNIAVLGNFRIAQSDDEGQIFATVGPAVYNANPQSLAGDYTPPRIARIDASVLEEDARQEITERAKAGAEPTGPGQAKLNWDIGEYSLNPALTFFRLAESCPNPQGLAIDSHDSRLFVACDNQKLLVVDSIRGSLLQTLTTGPGTDAIAYDENRGLIFAANGGGYGSLTVIRQHQTDSYAVIQNLPTMERARTLTLDPSTGQVYLVTDLHGANLRSTPVNGIGKLRLDPVADSFQVLVVGN